MQHSWWHTYLFIWSGQFVSMLSSTAVQFAIIIWLSLEYQSTQVLAYAGIAGLLPHALIGAFVGVFIDRWDRKKVMIFADAFIALCTLFMSVLMKNGETHLLTIYFLLACRSVGTAFHAPSFQAITPLIVPNEQLLRVAGINEILQSVSSIAGPVLGTIALVTLPIHQVLYMDIIGAIVAISSLFFVSIPKITERNVKKGTLKNMFHDLKLGIKTVLDNKGLSYLFLVVMISNIFFMPVVVLFPMLVTQHYGGGKFELGITETILGIGMLLGGLLLGIFKTKMSKVELINWTGIVVGICFIGSGIFPKSWFYEFLALILITGVTSSIFMAAFNATVQQIIVPNKLGRIFSIYLSFANVPSILGILGASFITQYVGVPMATIIAGFFTSIIATVSFLIPSLMNLERNSAKN